MRLLFVEDSSELAASVLRHLRAAGHAVDHVDDAAGALAALAVGEYAPNAVKKAVVGVGHADKGQVQHMVRHQLPGVVFEGADAADALAIAITHCHVSQNAMQMSDTRLNLARGRLR